MPSYTKLYAVRHAEAAHVAFPDIIAGRAPYSRITKKVGRLQAEQRGMNWDAEGIVPDQAHASRSIRALQTMNIALAKRAGGMMPIISFPELQEQCLGEHEGQERRIAYTPELRQEMDELGAKYRHPGRNSEGDEGESGEDVVERLARYMGALRSGAEPPETVVAVTHHVALKYLQGYVELGGFDGPVDPLELQSAMLEQPFIAPCAQTFFVVEGEPDAIRCRIEYKGQPLDPAPPATL